jgi:TonB family protein
MYFDFEDYRPDTPHLASPLTWRDVVFVTIILHLLGLLAMVTAPRWMPLLELEPARQAAVPPPRESPRFVFVQPRLDTPAPKPPPRAELSDQDRAARQRERAVKPTTPLPYSRGNSRERVERSDDQVARGQGPKPEPSPEAQPTPAPPTPPQPESQSALATPDANTPQTQPPQARVNRPAAGGRLGDALRNLDRYIQTDHFENSGGDSGAFGPAIQFDTKGVEFGPWIRRFIAQVKRNWLIPYAAMSMRGRVVVTFNVHKDGSITDLSVVGPSPVDAFNNAAFGALASSNPTQPLPPEYPSDKAFFTVTFFYNEQPQ